MRSVYRRAGSASVVSGSAIRWVCPGSSVADASQPQRRLARCANDSTSALCHTTDVVIPNLPAGVGGWACRSASILEATNSMRLPWVFRRLQRRIKDEGQPRPRLPIDRLYSLSSLKSISRRANPLDDLLSYLSLIQSTVIKTRVYFYYIIKDYRISIRTKSQAWIWPQNCVAHVENKCIVGMKSLPQKGSASVLLCLRRLLWSHHVYPSYKRQSWQYWPTQVLYRHSARGWRPTWHT